jgi:hypothetical protein
VFATSFMQEGPLARNVMFCVRDRLGTSSMGGCWHLFGDIRFPESLWKLPPHRSWLDYIDC